MTTPQIRVGIDWDGDFFCCYDCLETDQLNRLHTGLSSNSGFVCLHWNYVNTSAINSSTISTVQSVTDYGIRQLHCVTGTNTTAGVYFGRTGSTNDFSVSNATTYTCTFWIKATVGSGTSFTISMENSTGSSTFTISGSWQKVTRTFTTTSTTTAFKIAKNTSATNVTFDATGFMIVTGSTAPNGFNVGHATNKYDCLADTTRRVVRKADWQVGRRDWKEYVISEGTARLVLDNSTRNYSPEYSSSPLYGYLEARNVVTIDVKEAADNTWTRKFTGWTSDFQVMTGTKRARETTLLCEQGKFQLDKIQYTRPPSATSGTADTILKDIINNGYLSPATPLQCILGKSTFGTGYFRTESDVMSIETGVSTLSLTGEDWGSGMSASNALKEILKVDQGFFFIDAYGKVIYYNRLHYVDPATTPSATTISLDSETTAQEYSYGKPFYNNAQVTYYPYYTTNETIWQSPDSGIVVRGRRSKDVLCKFEFSEGKKKTVAAVNGFDADTNPSTLTLTSYVATQQGKVTAEITDIQNGQATLTLRNGAPMPLRVAVTLRGDTTSSSGGQMVEVSSTAGVLGGQVTITERSKLLSSENEARNLGNQLLYMYRKGIGDINSITFEAARNNTWLSHQLTCGQGSKLTLSETQTGHSSVSYVVIGEKHSWEPGKLTTTLNLFNLNRQTKYGIVGTSALDSNFYLGY